MELINPLEKLIKDLANPFKTIGILVELDWQSDEILKDVTTRLRDQIIKRNQIVISSSF